MIGKVKKTSHFKVLLASFQDSFLCKTGKQQNLDIGKASPEDMLYEEFKFSFVLDSCPRQTYVASALNLF